MDEDAVLLLLQGEVLMLLGEGEEWSKDDCSLSVSSCSTLTVNSVVENTEVTEHNQEENDLNVLDLPVVILKESTWDDFSIPWEKLQNDVLQACDEGRKEKHLITEVIHMVVASMRQVKTSIHSEAFRTIARKMGEKYPKMFKDYDEDGQILGNGYSSTYNKLVERNSYLNRPHKRNQDPATSDTVPLNKRRKLLKAKAGCSNWDPLPTTPTPDTETIKTILKNISDTDDSLWEYLEKSYAEQRKFINSSKDLLSILSEWPILFKPKVAIWHFKKLTGSQFGDITNFFRDKCKRILKFGEKRHKILVEGAKNETSTEILALQILTAHHKEKLEKIFFHKEVCFYIIES